MRWVNKCEGRQFLKWTDFLQKVWWVTAQKKWSRGRCSEQVSAICTCNKVTSISRNHFIPPYLVQSQQWSPNTCVCVSLQDLDLNHKSNISAHKDAACRVLVTWLIALLLSLWMFHIHQDYLATHVDVGSNFSWYLSCTQLTGLG